MLVDCTGRRFFVTKVVLKDVDLFPHGSTSVLKGNVGASLHSNTLSRLHAYGDRTNATSRRALKDSDL